MKLNVFIGIIFIIIAAVIFTLSWRGVFKDTWLDRADKVASIVAVLISIVAFFTPTDKEVGISPSMQFGDNAQGNVIGQSGSGDVTIGDTTTSAKQRADSALPLVYSEILDNFNSLAVTVQTISNRIPVTFWDSRRPNETESAYQDRAKNEYKNYQQEIEQYLRELQRRYSKNVYTSQQINLSYYPEKLQRIKQVYDGFDETTNVLTGYTTGLQSLASLSITDIERAEGSRLLHAEKMVDLKIELLSTAAQFCLITEEQANIQLLNDALNLAGINVSLKEGKDCSKIALQMAGELSVEKAEIISKQNKTPIASDIREIDKQINDPYLIMLRKSAGLPETLTNDEIKRLRSKEINLDTQDPLELFKSASLSYLESDGRAAIEYYRAALEMGTLSEKQKVFAQLSLDRLENPDKYDGSLGLLVIELTPSGNFEESGLMPGDVIIAIDGITINEPYDVASLLAKSQSNRAIVTIVRGDKRMMLSVKTHISAGSLVTQLVMLNAIQL